MKKYLVLALCLLMVTIGHAQNYTEYFADKTLRIDYIFTGNAALGEDRTGRTHEPVPRI